MIRKIDDNFKEMKFPVNDNGKISILTGEEIIKQVNLRDCEMIFDTHRIYPILTHLVLNELMLTVDPKIRIIIDEYYKNRPLNDMPDDLHYVNGFICFGYYTLIDSIINFYDPLIPSHLYDCEKIISTMNERYASSNYEIALNYTTFAEKVYKRGDKSEGLLHLVAKYGLMAYELKNDWFNSWKVYPSIRLDYFWITLCNVLKKLGRYDEAIDIATFATKNNAYDISKKGWKDRLDKLIKAKEKRGPEALPTK